MVREYTEKETDVWNKEKGILRAKFASQFILDKDGKLLDVAGYKGDLKRFISKDIDYYLIDLFGTDMGNSKKWNLDNLPLPYEDKYFDTIVALDIFEHVMNPYGLLLELKRILKDGGQMVASLHHIPTERHYQVLSDDFFNVFNNVWFVPFSEGKIVYKEYDVFGFPRERGMLVLVPDMICTETLFIIGKVRDVVKCSFCLHKNRNAVIFYFNEDDFIAVCSGCQILYRDALVSVWTKSFELLRKDTIEKENIAGEMEGFIKDLNFKYWTEMEVKEDGYEKLCKNV